MAASSIITLTPTNGVSTQVIGPNPRRKSIVFWTNSANGIYIDSNKQSTFTGLAVTGTTGPLTITKEKHGDIVEGPFFCWPISAGQVLTLLETIY